MKRTKLEKEEEKEILEFKGIRFNRNVRVSFVLTYDFGRQPQGMMSMTKQK